MIGFLQAIMDLKKIKFHIVRVVTMKIFDSWHGSGKSDTYNEHLTLNFSLLGGRDARRILCSIEFSLRYINMCATTSTIFHLTYASKSDEFPGMKVLS